MPRHRLLVAIVSVLALFACQPAEPSREGQSPASFGSHPSRSAAGEPHATDPASSFATDAGCSEATTSEGPYILIPGRSGARLTPIDPESLADRVGCAWLPNQPFGPHLRPSRRSYDGSLVATIESEQLGGGAPFFIATIVVQDGVTGEERNRFVPPGPIGSELRFSPDAALLLVQGWYATWRSDSVAWYVVDTASGELKEALRAEHGVYGHPFFTTHDSHLYRLIYRTTMEPGGAWPPSSPTEPGPWPLEIAVNDLNRGGAEVGRLRLPDVRAGSWWSERRIHDNLIPTQMMPGAALSSDGRRLFIAHADDSGVTVVDLPQLAVVRTITAKPQASTPTLLERLGFSPGIAHAKGMDTQTTRARLSRDGRLLLVWGGEMRMDQNGHMTEAASLRLFDPDEGRLHAQLPIESATPHMVLSLDGRWLFVATRRLTEGSTTPSRTAPLPPYILRLVDPTNLTVLAEREFENFPGRLYSTWEPEFDHGELVTTS